MNKVFLHCLGLLIVAIVSVSIFFLQNILSNNLYSLVSGEARRQLESSATLMTGDIRNDLLINDIRSARVKLGIFMKQRTLQGYKILKDAQTLDEVMTFSKTPSMVIRKEIPFSEGGAVWGVIEYHFSTEIFSESFEKLKDTLRVNLIFLAISVFLIVFGAFSLLYASSVRIYPVLDKFVTGVGAIRETNFVNFAWKPLIETLNGSVEKYENLRAKHDRDQKSAAIGRITSQLSHDLRAPLNSFERLLSLPDDSKIQSQKGTIRESLHRIHAMIESLRYANTDLLVQAEMMTTDFSPEVYDLDRKALQAGISLIGIPTDQKYSIRADRMKFERAWVNLVSNAIDFAKSTVSLQVLPLERDLVLRVIDDGPGVSEEFLPKLFQRGATHGKADGTGLGLAYVRQIMRGHGGDVTYRRESDLTIFECRLPNALEPEKEIVMKNSSSIEVLSGQKVVQSVAICLEPTLLTQSILSKLTSFSSDNFLFTEERHHANFVVSNIDEVMFEVLERDDQEFVAVAHLKGDEASILKILRRKFKLDVEGACDV